VEEDNLLGKTTTQEPSPNQMTAAFYLWCATENPRERSGTPRMSRGEATCARTHPALDGLRREALRGKAAPGHPNDGHGAGLYLATAGTAKASDLRCELREKLIMHLQERYPWALPRIRATVESGRAPA
jgi:hypothetical protein